MTKVEIIERYGQAYYDEHLRRSREKLNAAYAADPEFYRAKNRARDPEYVRAACRKHYRKHADKRKALAIKCYHAKREQYRAKHQQWVQANPEAMAVHCSRRRARKFSAIGRHTVAEWLVILKKHKRRCAYCGATGTLTKDHIIPLSRGGSDYPLNLQPLCAPCNGAKHAKLIHNPSLFDL